ncbi:O-glucosyltransferase rumi [Lucilia cuprina]|uniref:O-glucosyltransferase rumi n=1 Tax=Lucilia cuprina TaxID=7375 RepID=A0A0L0BN71_LUCCU|nr:O-glucosyltransferase rumi [Lucilia cuprina]KNC21462.1 O-glucosyltransferase rumi [Lucilia cuprina]
MHFLHLILTIFLIISKNSATTNNPESLDNTQCAIENKNDCQNDENFPSQYERYKEVNNAIFQDVRKAQKKYRPCTTNTDDDNCECHVDVIRKDLAQFRERGITKQMIKEAANYGTHYKIYKHKLYRHANCMFPSRCEGVEHFILKLLPKLPDMDFILNTRDYPQVHSKFGNQMRPVFSFSKTVDYLDIMYPAWTFWAGGPAISLHPTGIGRWDLHREKIIAAAEKLEWSSKESKAFFRGSRTSDERDSLVLLSRRKPNLVDAQYTKNQAWKSPKDTLNAEPAKEVSFEEHCRFKYLFNFRGVAASFRFKHLFLCKSLVFHVGDEWLEFFYPSMKPWIHYVPLKKYPKEKDIEDILQFFQKHDDLAREIANNGFEFISQHLRMQDVECYWRRLLKNYAKILKYKVEEDNSLIEIKEKFKK